MRGEQEKGGWEGRLKRGDDEEGIGVGEDDGQESCNRGEPRLLRSEREGQRERWLKLSIACSHFSA